jgi:hypothetical protein
MSTFVIASAIAPSVPGRGRSQRSAISAAEVWNGSITSKREPRTFACLSDIHCGGSATSGLRPTIMMQAELSTSSPPAMLSPVIFSITPRQPPQRS